MEKRPKRADLKPPGKCIFCGGPGLTKEHIFSEWMSKVLPKEPGARMRRFRTIVEPDHPGGPRMVPIIGTQPGDAASRQVRVVCRNCNGRWMGSMETDAKRIASPLILGQPTTLTREDILALSRWTALKTIVAEWDDPPTVTIADEVRQDFYRTKNVPPEWKMWLCFCTAPEWFKRYRHSAGARASVHESPIQRLIHRPDQNAQSTTVAFGCMFLFVTSHTKIPALAAFTPPVGLRQYMTALWPITGESIAWPPHNVIDSDELGLRISESYAAWGAALAAGG
jgi:hypothetical protein